MKKQKKHRVLYLTDAKEERIVFVIHQIYYSFGVCSTELITHQIR